MVWIILGRVADVVSVVAGVIAIVGVPLLWASTRRLYREFRLSREIKGVSDGCLEFSTAREPINLVPLEMVSVIPRPGDIVHLPGEMHDSKSYGAGAYVVDEVSFLYFDAPEVNQPCPAKPSKVMIRVREKGRA